MGVFETGARKHIAAVRAYFEEGDEIRELRRHAHSLKGLCLTYGATDGAEAAEALQEACDSDDADIIQAAGQAALTIIPKDIEDTLAAFQTLNTSA